MFLVEYSFVCYKGPIFVQWSIAPIYRWNFISLWIALAFWYCHFRGLIIKFSLVWRSWVWFLIEERSWVKLVWANDEMVVNSLDVCLNTHFSFCCFVCSIRVQTLRLNRLSFITQRQWTFLILAMFVSFVTQNVIYVSCWCSSCSFLFWAYFFVGFLFLNWAYSF